MASGLALVARTPTLLHQILQDTEKIKLALGADNVEQQEKWASYLLTPIPRHTYHIGKIEITPELLQQEINLATGITPCRAVWTRQSLNSSESEGTVLVSLTATKARSWPGRLRLFGQAVSVQPLQSKPRITICDNCFGFHHTRNCARLPRCTGCGSSRHEGNCKSPPGCLNCCGPHKATDPKCAACPTRRNRALIKPSKKQLQAIRANGSAAWHLLHGSQTSTPSSTNFEPDTAQLDPQTAANKTPPVPAPQL